ncbi:hypothetical protein FRB99_001010 [Tulasnella sp. 403]|nr:hypothetical protein FRB99_001010 [Tulasnella sp. 403]
MGFASTETELGFDHTPPTNTTVIRVPSLVGGLPTRGDFVPSILVVIGYALTWFPFLRRKFDPKTRSLKPHFMTRGLAVERIIVYSFRATIARERRTPGEVIEFGNLAYQQLSYATGFMLFLSDALALAKRLCITGTLDIEKSDNANTAEGSGETPELDRPTFRRTLRWMINGLSFMWVASMIMAIAAHSLYPSTPDKPKVATATFVLRIVGTAVALMLIIAYIGILYLARRNLQRIDHRAVDMLCGIVISVSVIPIYRLCVMPNTTTSLNVLGNPPSTPLYPPGSLSGPASKITFYLFESLPELLITFYLQCIDLHGEFNAGLLGDWQERRRTNVQGGVFPTNNSDSTLCGDPEKFGPDQLITPDPKEIRAASSNGECRTQKCMRWVRRKIFRQKVPDDEVREASVPSKPKKSVFKWGDIDWHYVGRMFLR